MMPKWQYEEAHAMPQTKQPWAAIHDRSPYPAWSTQPPKLRQRRRFAHFATIALIALILLFTHSASREYAKTVLSKLHILPTPGTWKLVVPQPGDPIPNHVNFVYALEDPNADFVFEFRHFLSVYATLYHFKPKSIFLHTNAGPAAIQRAKSGAAGVWAKRIFALPGFLDVRTNLPQFPNNRGDLSAMEAREQVMRVKALHDFGGVYIDFNYVALRDIAPVREMGVSAVGGWDRGQKVSVGVFMAQQHSPMTTLWMERPLHAYWRTEGTLDVDRALRDVCQHLITMGKEECTIMGKDAFSAYDDTQEEIFELYGVHDDTKSALEGLKIGGSNGRLQLPEFPDALRYVREGNEDWPEWARDWAGTYVLRGFHADANGPPGYVHLSPRYVLERRSNFARAAYPVVRDMYQKGLIEIDDTWARK